MRSANSVSHQEEIQIGTKLSGQSDLYDVETVARSAVKELEVTPITLYNSEYVYHLGNLIAVNQNYICYVVRGLFQQA